MPFCGMDVKTDDVTKGRRDLDRHGRLRAVQGRMGYARTTMMAVKFFTVSLLLADLHPNKILLFLRCQECQKCIGIGAQKHGN